MNWGNWFQQMSGEALTLCLGSQWFRGWITRVDIGQRMTTRTDDTGYGWSERIPVSQNIELTLTLLLSPIDKEKVTVVEGVVAIESKWPELQRIGPAKEVIDAEVVDEEE